MQVPLHYTVCKTHLELTFLCELTVKKDLHGVYVFKLGLFLHFHILP